MNLLTILTILTLLATNIETFRRTTTSNTTIKITYLGYSSATCTKGPSQWGNSMNLQSLLKLGRNHTRKKQVQTLGLIKLLLLVTGDIESNPGPGKRVTARNIMKYTVTIPGNKELLKELPKIKPHEYEGKEYCGKCHKPVNKNHLAIHCDKCSKWIHIKCSDCTSKLYRHYQEMKTFNWTCKGCRENEEVETKNEIFNRATRITENQLPISLEEVRTNKNEKLIIHYNCRSIENKLDELKEIIAEKKPILVLLTETWLNETHPKNYLKIPGYKSVRKDRSEHIKQHYGKTGGGGIALIYQEHLQVKIHDKLNTETDEAMWFTAKINKINHLFCLIYRPEYIDITTGENKIDEKIVEATNVNTNITIIGDLNYNLLQPSGKIVEVKEIIESFGMKQHIKKPTRIQNQKASLIDHIWTTEQNKEIVETGTIDGISDHTGIYMKLKHVQRQKETKITCRSYKQYKKEKLCEDFTKNLQKTTFYEEIEGKEVDKAMESFMEAIKKAADENAPFRTFKRKDEDNSHVPWFTQELRNLITNKKSILKLYQLYNNPEDKVTLKRLRNKINYLKKTLKRTYYTNKINEYKGKPKEIWKVLKGATGIYEDKENIEPEDMTQKKANDFNRFFATIGKNLQEKLGILSTEPNLDNLNQEEGFTFHEETEETISKLIDNIRIDVATGYCTISARILKDAKPSIVTPLTQLVNISFRTSIFPQKMKIAIIKPLFKNKGTEEDPQYYRPLSILSVISKIFERAATDQIVKHLETQNMLCPNQHAYRKNHSTSTSLIQLTEHIHKEMEKGNIIGIASLDLSKAFDTIDHNLLLRKLIDLQFNSNVTRWIKSYLENRNQRTKFTDYLSEEEIVEAGVPQGSILGPILFIIFTHDFQQELNLPNIHITAYADDTQLMTSGKTYTEIKERLEKAIEEAANWYTRNKLCINAGKSEILVVGTQRKMNKLGKLPNLKVTEGNRVKELEVQDNIKILGVYIDKNLNWNKQVDNVKRKAYLATKNMFRVKDILPMEARRKLYDSMITPHFNYCDTVWNGCTKEKEHELQRIQNAAAKAIVNRKEITSSQALKELKLLPLQKKREIHTAVMVFKTLEGRAPTPQIQEIRNCLPKHQYLTRATTQNTFIYKKHKHSKNEHSTIYKATRIWNQIPIKIRHQDTQDKFKNTLQNYLTQLQYP